MAVTCLTIEMIGLGSSALDISLILSYTLPGAVEIRLDVKYQNQPDESEWLFTCLQLFT